MPQLSRRARRGTLALHVCSSAGWLGMTLCLLALGLTAALTGSGPAAEASYRSMKVFADWLLAPLALLTLASGVLLSVGTRWGLARYWWVWIKFWLTLAAILASVLLFRTRIDSTVADVAAGRPILPYELVIPPLVSLGAYTFMTVISMLKPWGRTKRGRRSAPVSRRRSAVPGPQTGAPEPGGQDRSPAVGRRGRPAASASGRQAVG
ncbi:DUF2269 domain-containing protein [Streptomyces qinglanensis]|uniref:DUF2269 domain-containing protein n=1 Tax=Streptomyces qinglanensis TaxID=943816 RepID=A0A1H9Q082_9ACTN|nr:DUF2269 domain-containing protein [Streptomyces qinglanensis]SER53810.1 hypothetical protein SAMN05421870_102378 [Streptomyces qinglanensis]